MSMPAAHYYTAEMVRGLPDDGKKYETVHGELLVTPAPRPLHELIQDRISAVLRQYLKREQVGHLWGSRSDISWGADTLVQPDCFVVPLEQARTLDWSRMKSLLLAVEVLSPSSVRADRFTKRRLYQEQRIPVYWVVDCDAESVEVWTPEALFPVVEKERLTWQPEGASEPCIIDLGEIFAPI
ncbi:MAG TPA: Uma2 family endonuclease [Gemmatimonadales bacterium]|nr:Uma2 family endonuclease [Gemmatimonadales bacterium]